MASVDLYQDKSQLRVETDRVDSVESPETEKDLVRILQTSSNLVTFRGAGTGVTGGCVPTQGGIILATERMLKAALPDGYRQVDDEDVIGRSVSIGLRESEALVPPGISLQTLDHVLADHGMLMPNPTASDALLGAATNTNASGTRTFAFGAMRENIDSLRVVLADGDVLALRRGEVSAEGRRLRLTTLGGTIYEVTVPSYRMFPGKNAAGLYAKPEMDAIDLFIGSEGLLGAVSQVGLRLKPRRDVESGLFFFENQEAALRFIDSARPKRYDGKTGTGLISLEFYDRNSLELAGGKQEVELPAKAACAVQYEYFSGDEAVEHVLADLYEAHGVVDNWQDHRVVAFRHAVPETINGIIARYRMRKLGTDFAVPAEQFPAMMAAYGEAISRFDAACQTEGPHSALFGHVGNHHLHLNLIPRNPAEAEVALRIYTGLARKAVQLGGTVSAEHGVGKKMIDGKPYLHMMYGDQGLREIAAVKRVLDPRMRLNRGNMIGLEYC